MNPLPEWRRSNTLNYRNAKWSSYREYTQRERIGCRISVGTPKHLTVLRVYASKVMEKIHVRE
jgi:hypothetical protein